MVVTFVTLLFWLLQFISVFICKNRIFVLVGENQNFHRLLRVNEDCYR